ncbi:MAG TPA: right-handed parallel beta-helix repeat-containing protein [Bacteroidales bacterium]|mgnify:FL=1|nr:right-handed parallel beta-helix repeat-containing protein [Bacteroidales bacterium]HOU95587.1 right-handed parallel beta-helix repeat-containing protein [Bacteroidales bacterium]HQG36997.1 right-handed parallel beta-helix repeat-containing protein [Bacteroidales bacterium]HQG53161.1 right-handed parallel beta-helix repeat-containing protein [Bacteroidales bacterium]HRC88704.1 right-handed parallel beta-helix repeat-containing protein [Bacteroidales bacterium]
MKRFCFLIFLLAALLFLPLEAFCQKIYLSPFGDDSNPGTAEKPLATLTAACNMARQIRKTGSTGGPIEIIALSGEYFMSQPLLLTADDSGTESSPLIIKAEKGTKAIFKGGAELTGFEKVNDKLWRCFVPQVGWYDSYFEQLYVNGRRAKRARTPDEGFFTIKNVTEFVLEKGDGRYPLLAVQKIDLDTSAYLCFSNFSDDDYRDALIVFYHNWDNTRKRILGYSRETSSIYIAGKGMKPWNPLNNKSRYYIENYRSALDSPGEWYLDRSGYLYYIPLNGETIENTKFIAPVIKDLIVITGESVDKKVSNIRFENLSFQYSGYRTPADGNEPAQAAAPLSAAVTLDFARNIDFVECEIAHTGTYAMWFRRAVGNCLVNQCYMHDLGGGGVKIGETIIRPSADEITNHIVVDNNIITDAGHIFPCAVGIIIFNGSDNKLTHNEISNLRYSGISVGWVWGYSYSPSKRNLIAYNHIHHLGWGELCDMGGVYTLGASEGTVVSNNVIHHIYSFDYGGWGLYTDEGSYGITMENNLVYCCKNSGFHQHYGKENIIRNNIFALNIRAQLQATRIEEHRSFTFTNNIVYFNSGTLFSSNWHKINLLTDYNCYWDTRTKDIKFGTSSFTEWQKSGKDIHSIIADPLFINADGFDFRFRNRSVIKKIKFIPFDYTEAGVYGSDEWKKTAVFSRILEKKFDETVAKMESR